MFSQEGVAIVYRKCHKFGGKLFFGEKKRRNNQELYQERVQNFGLQP
jgi:hypothetical protein